VRIKAVAIPGLIGLFVALASQPARGQAALAVGQSAGPTKCTAWCSCENGNPCVCHSTGGHSQACNTDGGDCNTTSCGTAPAAFGWVAADGTILALSQFAPGFDPTSKQSARPAVWTTVSKDRSEARLCNGVVVARYYAPALASRIRLESQHLLI
jgi:hypothetical protein